MLDVTGWSATKFSEAKPRRLLVAYSDNACYFGLRVGSDKEPAFLAFHTVAQGGSIVPAAIVPEVELDKAILFEVGPVVVSWPDDWNSSLVKPAPGVCAFCESGLCIIGTDQENEYAWRIDTGVRRSPSTAIFGISRWELGTRDVEGKFVSCVRFPRLK